MTTGTRGRDVAGELPPGVTGEMVLEHVSDVIFDSGDGFEVDCLLCQAAGPLGIWARYGYRLMPDGTLVDEDDLVDDEVMLREMIDPEAGP